MVGLSDTGSCVLQLTMKYRGAMDLVKNFVLFSNYNNKNNYNNSTTFKAATTSSSRRELEAILFRLIQNGVPVPCIPWGHHWLLQMVYYSLPATLWVYEYTQAQNTMRQKKRCIDNLVKQIL